MPKYRLTYFDFSGSRGEDCRLALAAARVPFEDRRIGREQWAELKPSTPFGSIPLLEVEGEPVLAQSNAILFYIGTSYGLLPKEAWQAALHVSILEAVEELRTALSPSGRINDQAEKKRAREEFTVGPLNSFAVRIEARIQGPFIGGTSLSVADIKVFNMMNSFINGTMDFIPTDVFAPYEKLQRLHAAVATVPEIAAWRAAH